MNNEGKLRKGVRGKEIGRSEEKLKGLDRKNIVSRTLGASLNKMRGDCSVKIRRTAIENYN